MSAEGSGKIYLSGDLVRKFGVKINSVNSACEHGRFPCYKEEGSNYWRIPDTPELHTWLEAYKYRSNLGQGPKSKAKKQGESD